MKPFKTFLRIWLSLVSVLSFLAGWSFIATTSEQNSQAASTTTSNANTLTITLPAIPQIDQLIGNTTTASGNVQMFKLSLQPATTSSARLRTGGS